MAMFYAVVSSFDDFGRCKATVTTTREAPRKPETVFQELRDKDIYIDWFEGFEEAQAYAESVRRA